MKAIPGILIFIVTLLSISCKKDITSLPPATQTGANTFGCKIDGELWGPTGFGIASTAPILEANYYDGRTIIINARNLSTSPTESEFEIHLMNVVTPGVYLLNTNTQKYPYHTGNYAYYVVRKYIPLNEWMTTSQYSGQVEITKTDTINRIVSGTFQFQALNLYYSPQPVNVTEGRFDIKIE
jgi:uncharacterized protein DUF6252